MVKSTAAAAPPPPLMEKNAFPEMADVGAFVASGRMRSARSVDAFWQFAMMSEPAPAESQNPLIAPDAPGKPATDVLDVSPKLVTSTKSRFASNVQADLFAMSCRFAVPVAANVPAAEVSIQIWPLIPWRAVTALLLVQMFRC